MRPFTDGERGSLLARGKLVLVVMVALALVTMAGAAVRNYDTKRLNDENRRLNAENVRLNGCVRDLIVTINERSKFSAQLDANSEFDKDQDVLDRQATRDFWTGIASTQDPKRRLAIFEKYRMTGQKIEVRREQIAGERDAIIAKRDAYTFPSLAECQ